MQAKQDRQKIGSKMSAFAALLLGTLVLITVPAYSASKTVLVLGDSLSAEYGLPRGSGWVNLMQNRLRAEKIDATVINASISGETTAGGKTRLSGLLQQRPDVVVLELGGNDGLRGLSLAATQANLRDMVKLSTASGAQVLLIGMQIPPNYGLDYSKRFTAMFQGLGREKGVKLVPFLLAGMEDSEDFFQADRIHPNQQAQPLLLANVWPVLKSFFK